jgi:hypothetical protein
MPVNLDPIRNFISKGASKKSILYLVIVILTFFLAIGLIWYFSQIQKPVKEEKPTPAERTLEEILKEDLTAPSEKEFPVPEKVMKDLTSPQSKEKIPEGIIKNLTAPK